MEASVDDRRRGRKGRTSLGRGLNRDNPARISERSVDSAQDCASSTSSLIDSHLDRLGQIPPLRDLLGDERAEVSGLVSDGLDTAAIEPRGKFF